MGEVATCQKCRGQLWIVSFGYMKCSSCGHKVLFDSCVPSTEIVEVANDPHYGLLTIFSEKEISFV